jgi:hypothetical protein
MTTLKESIKSYVSSKPNRDIRTALHVRTIGRKYVTLVRLDEGCKQTKLTLQEFADQYLPENY